jgi:YD repeat-containing protein
MGSGISASQISVTSDGNGNLYLTDGVAGDLIKLDAMLNSNTYGVATVNFADGTKISRAQLIAMTTNTSLTDNYTYDGLGQRLKHWNNQLGSNVTEATDYDGQGRIVRQKDFGGYLTTYAYSFDGAMTTNGLGTFGGWTVTTTNAAGLTATKQIDYFGRTVGGTDFGNHTVNLMFDSAGRLVQQTNNAGQNLQYTYFNTGLLATSSDYVASSQQFPRNMVSTYSYDVGGNRLTESYTGSYTVYDYVLGLYQVTTSFENAVVTYDALNRMITFQDSGQNNAHPVTINYEYDADGNVMHMLSTYIDLVSNTNSTQDFWYRYDSVNRFVTTQGQLLDASGNVTQTRGVAGNHINAGATGTEITYDTAGNRATAVSANESESYKYTANGYLSAVYISGALRVQDVRDNMGRVTSHTEFGANGQVVYSKTDTYDAKSQVLSEQTSTVQSDGSTLVATTTFDYKADVGGGSYTGAYQGGNVTHSRTTNVKITSGGSTNQPTTDTVNSYAWWQQAQQSVITYKPDITQSTTNTSTFAYDASGHLTTVNIQDGRPRTVSYVTDAAGQILSRVEASSASSNPVEYYYDFNGMRLGDIGNNGPSQTNYAAAIAQRSQAAQTGPFAGGSAVSFADFDQSFDTINPYSTAEAGTNQVYTIQVGDTLQSIASAVWGDSKLWYLIAEANGLGASASLQAGQNIIIPSKVSNYHNDASTFRVYDPNKALGNVQPVVPHADHGGCGVFGQIIKAIVSIVVTVVALPFAGPFAPILGDLAGQTVALATGIQSSFDWKELGMAAASAGVSAGLDSIPFFASMASESASIGETIVHSAVVNAATQGVGVATGLQSRFDWAGVAAAAVSGGVIRAANLNLHLNIAGTAGIAARSVVTGMAGSIANAATRSLINGSDFGDNIIAGLPDVLVQTVGNMVADRLSQPKSLLDPDNGEWTSDGTTGERVHTERVTVGELPPLPSIGSVSDDGSLSDSYNLEGTATEWPAGTVDRNGNFIEVNNSDYTTTDVDTKIIRNAVRLPGVRVVNGVLTGDIPIYISNGTPDQYDAVIQQLQKINDAYVADPADTSGQSKEMFNLKFHHATLEERAYDTLRNVEHGLFGTNIHSSVVTLNLSATTASAGYAPDFKPWLAPTAGASTDNPSSTIWVRQQFNYSSDVLVHEFGHVLGLNDGRNPFSTMYYSVRPNPLGFPPSFSSTDYKALLGFYGSK